MSDDQSMRNPYEAPRAELLENVGEDAARAQPYRDYWRRFVTIAFLPLAIYIFYDLAFHYGLDLEDYVLWIMPVGVLGAVGVFVFRGKQSTRKRKWITRASILLGLMYLGQWIAYFVDQILLPMLL